MESRSLGPGDDAEVLAASDLFDGITLLEATARFLADRSHPLVIAYQDGRSIGFVTGVETTLCYGMWVVTDESNDAATATYRGAGGVPECQQVVLSWAFETNSETD